MMRYVPTNEMIETFGLKWLYAFEADSIKEFSLNDGILKVEPGNLSVPINCIRRLHILEGDCSERIPHLEDYPGVPLYYGSIETHTVYLEIIAPSILGNEALRLGVFNRPTCHLSGAKWLPYIPDIEHRKAKLNKIVSLFNSLYPSIRKAHIDAVFKELCDGNDNTECGVQNITFTPIGAKIRPIKDGPISSFFGFRESVLCKYSDIVVHVEGDELRPEVVRVQFLGHPNADMTFNRKFDPLCSYLIAPIVKHMSDRHNGKRSLDGATPASTVEQRLATLTKLYNSGAISQDEYNAKRIDIIDSI